MIFQQVENGGGLYLAQGEASDGSLARVGFLFQVETHTDATFELTQASWIDPSQQGYFLFFVPSSSWDWSTLATQARAIFVANQGSQFGWFSVQDSTLTASNLISVTGQGTASPKLSGAVTFSFNNINLQLSSSFFPVTIGYEDATDSFSFQSQSSSGQNQFALTVNSPSGAFAQFNADPATVILPMDDVSNPLAGSLNANFAFDITDLAAFEAGFMFFGPGSNDQLSALSYPLLRAPAGAATSMGFAAWLDVLQPLVDSRSFFQCVDPLVGSYFTAATGQAFALTTVSSGDVAQYSRLVLANRPVRTTADADYYYLTPAGQFGLTIDGASQPAGPASLVCGTAGTEFLSVSTTANAADTLVFTPGNPAYQTTTPAGAGETPSYLNSMNGNVTTAWAQLLTNAGSYVSQPQDSPLFHQPATGATSSSGQPSDGALTVYLLDFLPLPTWSASNATTTASNGPAATPMIPMVPFAGLIVSTADQSTPYVQMETTALNPTRKNAFTAAQATVSASLMLQGLPAVRADAEDLVYAMTPQGLLAGLAGTAPNQIWQATQFAISPALQQGADGIYLQFTDMGDQIRQVLQQNQIFAVISTITGPAAPPDNQLFGFLGTDQEVNIGGWPFSLSPAGTASPDEIPPILILKFHPGQSIQGLVGDITLWSQPDTFNTTFTATEAQAYIQNLITTACEAVYGVGNCPNGSGTGTPDTTSVYYNFYQVVTDPNWSGLLALNCNMQLDNLPAAIKALTGGMTTIDSNGNTVSNIAAFRVHHVGVSINDTDPAGATPTLSQSSLFALVDYEKPAKTTAAAEGIEVDYNFEVEYLQALFINSALGSFSCQINLTINNLFDTAVTQDDGSGSDASNTIVLTGSYQANSTTGDDSSSGVGTYSFIAETTYQYQFDTNPYLESITLTKLLFSFDQESQSQAGSDTSTIQASFGIWGAMVFQQFDVLDIFSFQQLTFNDLGIGVQFDLTIPQSGPPTTSVPELTFNPGNLRLDLANSPPKEGSGSMLSLLPFKLTSFLYNQDPSTQTVEDLGYYSLSSIPLASNLSISSQFDYALTFDLDMGTLGALVGSLEAFKFSFLVGWRSANGSTDGEIAFGVQLPQADGKLEITIEGIFDLSIEDFILKYQTPTGGDPILVVLLHNASLSLMGNRLPPGNAFIDFALFAPTDGSAQVGWMVAYDNTSSGGGGGEIAGVAVATTEGGDDSSPFELVYLGVGQRVGPSADNTPTNFADFLAYMTSDFFTAFQTQDYGSVYQPNGQWLALADFKLLGTIEVGFVFYDTTPFYSLTLNVAKLFNFEITYTKVSDSIGLFYAVLGLPDNLRTYQVGAASLTLPTAAVSVYTNGNWKLNLGFPNGDDWSNSFQIQAQAGPVPVTGSGGFYIASLSSATTNIFKGTYSSILEFGLAAQLGVGKDFTSGPFSAGVSVTFFGIIQGAAGYSTSSATEIFSQPNALMLQGQFGIIGQLYGSIDFIVIKASVNVRLQASIGIVLYYEPPYSDGSILLYIQASVSVSVKVEINLGLFSITISYSFNASFRFDWQVAGQSQAAAQLATTRLSLMANRAAQEVTVLPLVAGFTPVLTIWYTPEGTVIFPSADATGVPWVVSSLAVQYEAAADCPSLTNYAAFPTFEKITTQLTTWALGMALGQSGSVYDVPLSELSMLDQNPDLLLAGIDYDALLSQLAVFNAATVSTPDMTSNQSVSAATFPMPPFFNLQTSGRMVGGQPADLDYLFSSKNNVPSSYLSSIDAYFNQLFVNQTSSGGSTLAASAAGTTIPLSQEIFLDYFTGLIRGAVHQLLATMQDANPNAMSQNADPSESIDALILATVQAGGFATLSGQMSSSFRGGARLPNVAGLTLPDGQPPAPTNALYALLWQEFPTGDVVNSGQYTITLTNADSSQTWITSSASYPLTSTWLASYEGLTAADVIAPSTPQQLPFTDTGPQAFAFQNVTTWTLQPAGTLTSLCPFPPSLQALQGGQDSSISALVESRAAGDLYLPGGTTLDPSGFTWATQISLIVSQIPGADGKPLANVFSIGGASEPDELLLQQILTVLETSNPIASIDVLYQTSAGASGLTSSDINSSDVFALRTNTTTVSSPPPTSFLAIPEAVAPPTVPVGATIADGSGFLTIIQQAVVTNATGYYLRYQDASKNSLPTALFSAGPAPLTLLITYTPNSTQQNTPASPAVIQPYYNAISITGLVSSLVYYAETTDPSLEIQYCSVAAGCVGVVTTLEETPSQITPNAALQSAASVEPSRGYRRSELMEALGRAGHTDPKTMEALVTDSGGTQAQLNSLYSLVSYQVNATQISPLSGFIQSNLSAPIQPQQAGAEANAADGLMETVNSTSSYRMYLPLYNLATANQPLTTIPNRYASITVPISATIYQTDAFGNQMPTTLSFSSTNYYYDPIVPFSQWQGLVTVYDFNTENGATSNTLTVYLILNDQAFLNLTPDQFASLLQLWTTIEDQITGAGVSFLIETDLALQPDGSMVEVALNATQTAAITAMVGALVTWLQVGNATSPFPTVVPLSVEVVGPGELPPAFEINVSLSIEREISLISPLLVGQDGVVTFPSCQRVDTAIAATVGGSDPNGTVSVDINTFAADFVTAFPKLALSVGLVGTSSSGGSSSKSSASPGPDAAAAPPRNVRKRTSRKARNADALKAAGVAGDGSGSGQSGPQSLWAVQQTLLGITIGSAPASGPFYLSPKPLDNALNSATVPLPTLPPTIKPPNWAASQLVTNVDLDVLNSAFFGAVDGVLAPASAAQAFLGSPTDYDTIANGRGMLAQLYSDNEIDWLFPPQSPYSGPATQLAAGQTAFAEQMRAALATAYSTDTILQYGVNWTGTVPPSVGDQYELYGTLVAMSDPSPVSGAPATLPNGLKLSAPHVAISASGPGLMTFTAGVSDVIDTGEVSTNLYFNVTHIQHFLESPSQTPAGEATPSLWLQLIDPYTSLPEVGTTAVVIPLVLREFPTPPTMISQTATPGSGSSAVPPTNPLVAAAAWHLDYSYQVQLTPHDQLITSVTYNTNLSVTGGHSSNLAVLNATSPTLFTLFQSLARFSTTYSQVLQPILGDLSNPNWADALGVFAQLVQDVVNNTTWTPLPEAFQASSPLVKITDSYTVTDVAQSNGQQLITLSWDQQESSFQGVTLQIEALNPTTLQPYAGQSPSTGTNSITDSYTPNPPLTADWVVHRIEVDNLNVLTAENALASAQVERNAISLTDGSGTAWTAQREFIYMTPVVSASQPTTPFVDNATAINVESLPNQGIGTGCTQTSPSVASLCNFIYTIMYDLLADDATVATLTAAQHLAGADADVSRRLKVACSFQYPLASVGGVTTANPVSPVMPVVLARSFLIDAADPSQLSDFSGLYASSLAEWATSNAVPFGTSAQAGAQFVFDITLYAELSGLNTPVLRLRTLQLKTADVAS